MTKPISTRVHGILDYMTAAFLHTLPRVMGWSGTATCVMDTAGVAATTYSLMTRYEMGVLKVLPMKAHLTLDAVSGAGLIGAALLLEDEDPDVRATIAAIGLYEIGAALLTQTRSPVPPGRKVRQVEDRAASVMGRAKRAVTQRATAAVQGL